MNTQFLQFTHNTTMGQVGITAVKTNRTSSQIFDKLREKQGDNLFVPLMFDEIIIQAKLDRKLFVET